MFKKLQKSKFLGTIENIERLLYMEKGYTSITLKERPDLKAEINVLYNIGWINFMREDLVAVKYWNKLLSYFPEFQDRKSTRLNSSHVSISYAVFFLI